MKIQHQPHSISGSAVSKLWLGCLLVVSTLLCLSLSGTQRVAAQDSQQASSPAAPDSAPPPEVTGGDEKEEEDPLTKSTELLGAYAKLKTAADWFPKGVPLPARGVCVAGSTYVVTSQSQLYGLVDDLDCIWSVGRTPLRVPLGDMPGKIISLANTAVWASYGENSFRGCYTWETVCQDRLSVFGYDGVTPLRLPITYARWEIVDKFPAGSVATGEVVDNRGGLFVDYSVDLTEECPVEGNVIQAGAPPTAFLPALSGFKIKEAPTAAFRTLFRSVGRDSKGGVILLGRCFMIDAFQPARSWVTVAWAVVTTTMPGVLDDHDLKDGAPLGPVPYDFSWNHIVSTEEVFERLNALAIASATRLGVFSSGGAASLANAAYNRFGLHFGDLGETARHYVGITYSDAAVGRQEGGAAVARDGVYPTRSGVQRGGGRNNQPPVAVRDPPPYHVYMGRGGGSAYRRETDPHASHTAPHAPAAPHAQQHHAPDPYEQQQHHHAPDPYEQQQQHHTPDPYEQQQQHHTPDPYEQQQQHHAPDPYEQPQHQAPDPQANAYPAEVDEAPPPVEAPIPVYNTPKVYPTQAAGPVGVDPGYGAADVGGGIVQNILSNLLD